MSRRVEQPEVNLEFPPGAADPPEWVSRRDFLTLLGAGAAMAAGACMRRPDKPILPYVEAPADVVPGMPLYYATAMPLDGYATGVLVRSNTGRPTKIEGNPDHPASLGASGALEQASLLELYDPHRAEAMRVGRRRATWDAFAAAFAPAALSRRVGARGAGLRVLMPPTTSPLTASLLGRLGEAYPDARTHFFAPLASPARIAAARTSLGAALVPQYDFRAADVVVALDADILATGPFHLRYAREWADRRRASPSAQLHVAEPTPSPTGTLAARRLGATWSAVAAIATALVDAVHRDARSTGRVSGTTDASGGALTPDARAWVAAVAADLAAHAGHSIVVCGERQPSDVHVLTNALNDALGNVGTTVWYTPPAVLNDGGPDHDLSALATELRTGGVDTLVILDGNPCYGAPSDIELSRVVGAVHNTVYLGAYDDETARVSTWHLPAAHYLESWGDARAYDGTTSVIQPLIAPLHGGRTADEVLAVLAGQPNNSTHDLLRDAWNSARGQGAPTTESDWSEALRRGVVAGSAFARATPAVRGDAVAQARATVAARGVAREQIEIGFVPSHAVHDGRFADNGWLQELPDPVTKLTWGNAALMAPAMASRLGVATNDVVKLQVGDRALDTPVLVVPGHADGAVALAMGYGRQGGEAVARGVGVNANALRTSQAPHVAPSAAVSRTGRSHELALAQTHWAIEGRGSSIVGEDGEAQRSTASSVQPRKRRPLTLYEPKPPSRDGFGADQWAMVIDLDVCTGCSACVVACQAENNIPVVGKDGVMKSREMHWLRIDRYIDGPPDDPRFETQPMLCQHCEKAPCEYVCPVNATVHSEDGLNEMVYNRCVGTRFCSNNCPYKVRRFNWFDYNGEIAETERMAKNPEVTIRARGVMEKCTFCVQRIRDAQMASRLAGDPATGPVVTACQQSCPTQAIVFGSLTDPESEVSRQFGDPRSFSALDELGTVPRVRYLARRREADSSDSSGGRAR